VIESRCALTSGKRWLDISHPNEYASADAASHPETATAAVPEKKITASWHGLLEFFYLPEVLLFLLLAWLGFAGPGRASLDATLTRRR